MSSKIERINELVKQLNAAAKAYYQDSSEIMSNYEYDALYDELVELENRAFRLKNELDKVREEYDYIVIDCPPSLGILTINALAASDGVVIPMQCEYFALEGLSQLMMTIRKVKELYNPDLSLLGILITMYNGRLNLSMAVLNEIKKYYKDKLFSTMIPRSVKLSEAPGFGEPINYHDKYSKASDFYVNLTKEIIQRIGIVVV